MNAPLGCEARTYGIVDGDVVAIHCRDCSRRQSGRHIKVHVYHRSRLTLDGPVPLPDVEVLAGTPLEDVPVRKGVGE